MPLNPTCWSLNVNNCEDSTVFINNSPASLPVKLRAALKLLRTQCPAAADWCNRLLQLRGDRKHCPRKQKRDKRAGLLAMLKANTTWRAIMSLFLVSVCSFDNEINLSETDHSLGDEELLCFSPDGNLAKLAGLG